MTGHVQPTGPVGRSGGGAVGGRSPVGPAGRSGGSTGRVGAPQSRAGGAGTRSGGAQTQSRPSQARSGGTQARAGAAAASKSATRSGTAQGRSGAVPSQRAAAPTARARESVPRSGSQDGSGAAGKAASRLATGLHGLKARGLRLPSFVRPEATSRIIGIVCIVTFVAALVVTLFVNIWLARGAYQLKALQTESAILAETEQIRSEELSAMTAPAALCQSARDLGMQPATSVKFIRLQDGQVLGVDDDAAPEAATPGVGVCAPIMTDQSGRSDSDDSDSDDSDAAEDS